MINKLIIENFQSWEEAELEFHPGVNVIIGSTDSGKTALIRALRKITWNKPTGDSFVSWWADRASIEIKTDEGDVVWEKGKTDLYKLFRAGEALVFKAFGTSVPDEITSFLNITEINLQRQLDSPFLISETPGAVASYFNKIAKLEKIDIGTNNVNSAIRELTSEIKYDEGQLKEATELLTKYNHLEKAEIQLEVLETMNDRLNTKRRAVNELSDLISDLNNIAAEIESISNILKVEDLSDKLFKLIDQRKELSDKKDKLYNTLVEMDDIVYKIKTEKQFLTIENPLTTLLKLNEEKNSVLLKRNSLLKQVNNINNINTTLKQKQLKFKEKAEYYESVFPDVCILCGQKVDKKLLHKH